MTSTAVKAMFSRVDAPADPYDPTLTVDGLSEFFEPRNSSALDPTLDASSLGDFFHDDERETVEHDLSDVFEEPRPTLVLVSSREEQANEPVQVEYEEVCVPEPVVTPAPAFSAPELVLSAPDVVFNAPEIPASTIQREVMDFERFAETFHAFARETQGLRVF